MRRGAVLLAPCVSALLQDASFVAFDTDPAKASRRWRSPGPTRPPVSSAARSAAAW